MNLTEVDTLQDLRHWVEENMPDERGREQMNICKECEGDGCTICTVFCGDCLTPIENCGCLL